MFLKWGFEQYFVVLKYFLSSILFCTLKRLFSNYFSHYCSRYGQFVTGGY